MFQAVESRLLELVDAQEKEAQVAAGAAGAVTAPFYVYLAADNQEVKQALFHYIQNNTQLNTNSSVKVMQVQSSGVMHAKNLARHKEAHTEGLLDLVLDWYVERRTYNCVFNPPYTGIL
jgi:hypothetical protein